MPARHAICTVKLAMLLLIFGVVAGVFAAAQDSGAGPKSAQAASPADSSSSSAKESSQQWSGMYTFLKEGEFVQLTVEDQGQVTGFVSRYGDGESDKSAFLDQFFKSAKLDGNKLTFTTEVVHGMWFDFQGAVERGTGNNPGDEAYYVLKGSLTESSTDAKKKVSTRSREVALKMFPQEAAGPAQANPSPRN
jgi:hypothetical protein